MDDWSLSHPYLCTPNTLKKTHIRLSLYRINIITIRLCRAIESHINKIFRNCLIGELNFPYSSPKWIQSKNNFKKRK